MYAAESGLPTLAEDESLYVDFLPKDQQPGVLVRRVGGRELTDQELIDHWEAIVKNVPEGERVGNWRWPLSSLQGYIGILRE
jgi:hypothetical protein